MKLATGIAKAVSKFIAVSCGAIRLEPSPYTVTSERETEPLLVQHRGHAKGKHLSNSAVSGLCRFLAARDLRGTSVRFITLAVPIYTFHIGSNSIGFCPHYPIAAQTFHGALIGFTALGSYIPIPCLALFGGAGA
jgi:hypothetical protein